MTDTEILINQERHHRFTRYSRFLGSEGVWNSELKKLQARISDRSKLSKLSIDLTTPEVRLTLAAYVVVAYTTRCLGRLFIDPIKSWDEGDSDFPKVYKQLATLSKIVAPALDLNAQQLQISVEDFWRCLHKTTKDCSDISEAIDITICRLLSEATHPELETVTDELMEALTDIQLTGLCSPIIERFFSILDYVERKSNEDWQSMTWQDVANEIRIGDSVRLKDLKGLLSPMNQIAHPDWPSEHVRSLAGQSGWGDWVPESGMEGVIRSKLWDGPRRGGFVAVIEIEERYVCLLPESYSRLLDKG